MVADGAALVQPNSYSQLHATKFAQEPSLGILLYLNSWGTVYPQILVGFLETLK